MPFIDSICNRDDKFIGKKSAHHFDQKYPYFTYCVANLKEDPDNQIIKFFHNAFFIEEDEVLEFFDTIIKGGQVSLLKEESIVNIEPAADYYFSIGYYSGYEIAQVILAFNIDRVQEIVKAYGIKSSISSMKSYFGNKCHGYTFEYIES